MSTIKLVDLAKVGPKLLTAYNRLGQRRVAGGAVVRLSDLVAVGASTMRGWQLSAGNAASLVRLDAEVRATGGAPLRLTSVFRDQAQQAKLHDAYQLWLQAGRPKPNAPGWKPTMRVDAASPPGRSNHGWGGAVDFDVATLEWPGTGVGTNEALARFWGLARGEGWTPIISEPWIGQSESWHFDRFPSWMRDARSVMTGDGVSAPYGPVAELGCILAGTLPNTTARLPEKYVQARLYAGGVNPGKVDGVIGPKTLAAVKEATDVDVERGTATPAILTLLNEHRVGFDALAAT